MVCFQAEGSDGMEQSQSSMMVRESGEKGALNELKKNFEIALRWMPQELINHESS